MTLGWLFLLQILFCLLLPFVPSSLSSLLLAYLFFSKFVSLLLIDQSHSLSEILPIYLVFWLLCIYERLCLTRPRFLYVWRWFWLFFCFYTVSPYVRIYRSFDIFYTIETVLGPMYFSTTVASAGWFPLVVTSLSLLKFWVIIFFSLLPESMIGIYAWFSLRKQHQTPRYFWSLFWLSLSFDSLKPVFEVWDRVRSLISTKLCVWFPRLLPTLGLVRISDIWRYLLTISLV